MWLFFQQDRPARVWMRLQISCMNNRANAVGQAERCRKTTRTQQKDERGSRNRFMRAKNNKCQVKRMTKSVKSVIYREESAWKQSIFLWCPKAFFPAVFAVEANWAVKIW